MQLEEHNQFCARKTIGCRNAPPLPLIVEDAILTPHMAGLKMYHFNGIPAAPPQSCVSSLVLNPHSTARVALGGAKQDGDLLQGDAICISQKVFLFLFILSRRSLQKQEI